jgi:tetratricopeptide (TPR) repeat protein
MHSRWKLLTLAAAIVLSTSSARADDCPEGPDEPKCLTAKAQAMRDSNPAEAASLYLRSYRLEPKIDPLANYGTSLAAAERYVEAVEALEKAVEEYDKLAAELQKANTDAKTLFAVLHRVQFVREELNKLAQHVGKIHINVADKQLPPGITVVRKGGDVLLRSSDPTKLVVGLYGDVLVWTYPSGRTFEQKVNVSAGTFSKIDVPPEPPPPPPPPVIVRPVEPNDGADRKIGSYVAGGVATVMLVWGIAYLSLADGASPAVSGVLIGGGVATGAFAIYLYLSADEMRLNAKAWRDARDAKPATTTTFVPVITDQMIGGMITGTL